jgi:hypothetical protein
MRTDTAAGELAAHLPGDYQANLAEVVRLRGRRVLRLRAAGLDARAIHEATGWTYRQQLWAVKAARIEKGGR